MMQTDSNTAIKTHYSSYFSSGRLKLKSSGLADFCEITNIHLKPSRVLSVEALPPTESDATSQNSEFQHQPSGCLMLRNGFDFNKHSHTHKKRALYFSPRDRAGNSTTDIHSS